ncbi:MAG: prolipoprotein diacylglyceryl transferase [Oscillospiraceae bacterium]|nr:prolipoprotein diacylglyceryl transferase [Oscillospiraceae bacterium]
MNVRTDMPISFPGLFPDWSFNPSRVAIDVGNGIYWYGIIICAGLILAVLFCAWRAKDYGLTGDNVYDMIIWQIPLCILGSRIYYVVFYLDLYRNGDGSLNWGKIAAIWDGGLAIYGTVIMSCIVLWIFCKRKKIPFGAFADLGCMGLLIGQSVGRWGNFMNREAFGGETTVPWRMRLWTSATEYIEVHPTFFYESLWNLIGLLLIVLLIARARTFDGENTCFYFIWYGIGRAWIEGMRTDSLYFFNAQLFGQPVRVSQVLSLVLAAAAFVALVVNKRRHPHGREALYVTRKAAMEAVSPQEEQEAAEHEP